MEFVILGYLLIKDLSQYDLLQALSKEISPFYKPSLGSIQNALKKLVTMAYVSQVASQETGRKKYLYSVTESGRSYFKDWMVSSFKDSKIEMDLNTRLFFLGHLDFQDRDTVYGNALDAITSALEGFYLEKSRVKTYQVSPGHEDVFKYQVKTLELAIVSSESLREWLIHQRRELNENAD